MELKLGEIRADSRFEFPVGHQMYNEIKNASELFFIFSTKIINRATKDGKTFIFNDCFLLKIRKIFFKICDLEKNFY
jgi:hypothetical protein